jgi:hypothetical protein
MFHKSSRVRNYSIRFQITQSPSLSLSTKTVNKTDKLKHTIARLTRIKIKTIEINKTDIACARSTHPSLSHSFLNKRLKRSQIDPVGKKRSDVTKKSTRFDGEFKKGSAYEKRARASGDSKASTLSMACSPYGIPADIVLCALSALIELTLID